MARHSTRPASETTEGRACVVILEGDRPGRRVCFVNELVIGRGSETDLAVMGSRVSRTHAAIRFHPGEGWVLEDLGSKNGTFVGHQKTRRCVIGYGDRFRVGGNLLLFTYHDRLEERLEQKKKLEVAGRMGAGVAHDFNNLLGIIAGALDYLEHRAGPKVEPDVKACHADIRTAIERATDLTDQLLNLAKGREEPLATLDAAEVLREVATLVGRTFDDRIRLRTTISAECKIFGRRGQLHQALMNLCLNARDAMLPEGGTLELDVDVDVEPTADPRLGSPHVRITIRDDGQGIAPEHRDRLFEPFFSTKGQRGNGLGLANVLEAMIDHGGTVEVESEPEQGTLFTLRFPTAATASRVFVGGAKITPKTASQPIAVLVVDDEPMSRRSMARVIEHLGHRAVQAANGVEAIAALEEDPRIQLVVLDYEMPLMDGERCFEEIRERFPTLRVAFASGSLTHQLRERLRAFGAVEVFDKPFEVSAFGRLLDRVSDIIHSAHTTSIFAIPDLELARHLANAQQPKS